MKNREEWIDVLKGFGALFVLLGHVVSYTSNVKIYLYSFHIPLFFFVSGYLFKKNKNILGYTFDKFKRFIIPYFIFSFLSMFVFTIINGNSMGKREIIKNFFFLYGRNPWNSSLWFLVIIFFTLIIMNILFNVDDYLGFKTKFRRILYLIFTMILCIILVKYNVKFYFGLEIVPHMLLVSYIGYIVRQHMWLDNIEKRLFVKIVILPMIIMGAFLALYNGRINVSTSIYCNYYLYILVWCVNLFVYICLSKWFSKSKMLKTISIMSMFMFCTQRILFMFYYLIQNKYHITFLESDKLIVSFGVFFITLLIYYCGYYLYSKVRRVSV